MLRLIHTAMSITSLLVVFALPCLPQIGRAAEFSVAPQNTIKAECIGSRPEDDLDDALCVAKRDVTYADNGLTSHGAPRSDSWDDTYAPTTTGLYDFFFKAGNGGDYLDFHADAAQAAVTHGQVIRLRGKIERGDAQKLADFVTANDLLNCVRGDFCPFNNVISFDSPGGNLAEALKIAAYVRQYQFVTVLEANSLCASSCVFAFFAGYTDYAGYFFPRRFAHVTARVGVHQPSLTVPKGSYSADQLSRAVAVANEVQAEALRQFTAAEVGMLVLRQMYDTPADTLSYLSAARLEQAITRYGGTYLRAANLARTGILTYCGGQFETLTGALPQRSLLRNLRQRGDSFVTFSDAGDFACYGTKQDNDEWASQACLGRDCLVAQCTWVWNDTADGIVEEDVGLCPDGGYAQEYRDNNTSASLSVALARLPQSVLLRYVRAVLLDRHFGLEPYARRDRNLMMTTFDYYDGMVPIDYCGQIDFHDPDIAIQLQTALNLAGYDTGTPDGIAGRKTFAAVTQANQTLLGTGDHRPSDQLLLALGIPEVAVNAMRLCSAAR